MSPFSHLFTRFRISACVLALTVPAAIAGPVPTNKPTAYPAWWFERDVIPRLPASANNPTPVWPTDYPPADDYAVANIGQLKHIATKAAAELDAKLPPPGAGTTVRTWVNAWQAAPALGVTRDDYTAVNLGQVKAVAKPFYDRLAELGYTGQPLLPSQIYPWTGVGPDDYALANIGQMKYVFRFSVVGVDLDAYKADADGDGIPYGWEVEHGLNPSDPADASAIVNGLTNRELFQQSLAAGGDPLQANSVGLLIYTPY